MQIGAKEEKPYLCLHHVHSVKIIDERKYSRLQVVVATIIKEVAEDEKGRNTARSKDGVRIVCIAKAQRNGGENHEV